jgi:hypothetical protein
MTNTLSLVSHKNYNLDANEGCVMFLTSKLITCFIDGFTSKRKCQFITYLLNGSEHEYWILDLETFESALNMGYNMVKRPSRMQGSRQALGIRPSLRGLG